MKVYFTNTGCSAETEDFLRFIRLVHAEQTSNFLEADVIVAHFCAMCTENFEAIPPYMAVLNGIKKYKAGVKIYVGGCASELVNLKKRYPFVDGVFNRRHMVEDLSTYFKYDIAYVNSPISYLNCVRIQSGCSRHCGFCKKAYLKMPLCSKPISKVLADIMHAVSNGYPDIILHAENSTEYGMDLPGHVRLLDLLRAIEKIEGVKTIYLSALCIDELTAEIVDYIKNSTKIYKLQLEIQSLIPEVRKNMLLTSTVEDVLKIIAEFSNKHIVTNIMLGYPGETWENFEQELELIERYALYFVQINTYNDTPGVLGHSLKQISEADVNSRMDRMLKKITKLRAEKTEKMIKASRHNAIPCVYTTGGRLEILGESATVNVGSSHNLVPGQIVNVRITGIDKTLDIFDCNQTFSLKGRIV